MIESVLIREIKYDKNIDDDNTTYIKKKNNKNLPFHLLIDLVASSLACISSSAARRGLK